MHVKQTDAKEYIFVFSSYVKASLNCAHSRGGLAEMLEREFKND